ncbi:uncharacterized protein O3C94_016819 [Discoglossus pictus]
MDKKKVAEKFLNHALEIIFLLTGEEYTIVKKNSPHSHHLTGEVPVKCDDVAIYFSMEEWEYIEGHKELYKDVMLEDHQTLSVIEIPANRKSEVHDESRNTVSINGEKEVKKHGDYIHHETHSGELIADIILKSEQSEDQCVQSQLEAQEREIYGSTDWPINRYALEESHTTECSLEGIMENNTSLFQKEQEQDLLKETTLCEKGNVASTSVCEQNVWVQYEQFVKDYTPRTTHRSRKSKKKETTDYTNQVNKVAAFTAQNKEEMSHMCNNNVLPYVCLECGNGFSSRSNLVIHEKLHMSQKCGKLISQLSTVVKHKKNHRDQREKKFLCSYCEKGFSYRSQMLEHQITHTGEKPYVCHQCGKGFAKRSNLVKHHRTHTGEKPYVCQICAKGFTERSKLVLHHRTHTGEKPFVCPECGRGFSVRSSMLTHYRRHM